MKKLHMRRCIACMQSKPKNELYRIVRCSDSIVRFDSTGKMSGRGTYICSIDCLNKAIKTKKISKEFDLNISQENYQSILDDFNAYIK